MKLIPVLVACTNPSKFTEAVLCNLIRTLVACFSSKRNPHYATIKTHFTEETQPLFLYHHQTIHTKSEYKLVTNKIVDFEVGYHCICQCVQDTILCSATIVVFCFQMVFVYLQWIVPDSLLLLGSVMTAFLLANKTLTGLCMTNSRFIDSIYLSKVLFQITTVFPILTILKWIH